MPNSLLFSSHELVLTVIILSAKYFPIPTLSSLNIYVWQIYYAIMTVLLFEEHRINGFNLTCGVM